MVQIWAVAAISIKIEITSKMLRLVNEADNCGNHHPCIKKTLEGNCHLTIHRPLCRIEDTMKDTMTMSVVIMKVAECGSQIMRKSIREHRRWCLGISLIPIHPSSTGI